MEIFILGLVTIASIILTVVVTRKLNREIKTLQLKYLVLTLILKDLGIKLDNTITSGLDEIKVAIDREIERKNNWN
jgi:hypothetical protein